MYGIKKKMASGSQLNHAAQDRCREEHFLDSWRTTFRYLTAAISLDEISHYRDRRLDGRSGSRVPLLAGSKIIFSPPRPDRLSSPPTLLSEGYWGQYLRR